MPDTSATEKICQECGATIYPEHIAEHTADLWAGKLLCPHCLRQKRGEVAPSPAPAAAAASRAAATGIVQSGGGPQLSGMRVADLLPDSPLASRCKIFHCKLIDASIGHLTDQINDWIASENVAIKFATTNIGIVEGKSNDTHLVVTLFY
jgi:hypothetical protein